MHRKCLHPPKHVFWAQNKMLGGGGGREGDAKDVPVKIAKCSDNSLMLPFSPARLSALFQNKNKLIKLMRQF